MENMSAEEVNTQEIPEDLKVKEDLNENTSLPTVTEMINSITPEAGEPHPSFPEQQPAKPAEEDHNDLYELINNNYDLGGDEKKRLYRLLVDYSRGDGNSLVFQIYFIMKMILKSTAGLPDVISDRGDQFVRSCERLIDVINKPNLEVLRTNISELKQTCEGIRTNLEVESRNIQKDIDSSSRELKDIEKSIEEKKIYLDGLRQQSVEIELKTLFNEQKKKWGTVILVMSLAVSLAVLTFSIYISASQSEETVLHDKRSVNSPSGNPEPVLKYPDFNTIEKDGNLYVKLAEPMHIFRTGNNIKYGKIINGSENRAGSQ